MAITEEKNIDILEKLADGNYKIKYPKTQVSQVVGLDIATTYEAKAGTSNSKYMTPLRVKEAVGSGDFSKIVQVASSSKVAKTLVNVSGSGICVGGTIAARSSGCNVTMIVDGVSKTLLETRFKQTNSGEDRTHVPTVRYKESLKISHSANSNYEVNVILAYIPD